ncbi:MAG: hypothetical protein ACTSUB_07365 [Candidatus Thorarchaeota archaeon]
MDTDKLLKVLCKRVKKYEGLKWLDEYTEIDVCSFRPTRPPNGEVLTKEIGPWFTVVVNIAYEGTTMDPSCDRSDGDPYSAMVRYDWIGPKDTVRTKISTPTVLDKWAAFKTWYSREYTALGSRGQHRGSWVTGMDEDGTVYLREANREVSGWFLDVAPESLTTEKTIKLELPEK